MNRLAIKGLKGKLYNGAEVIYYAGFPISFLSGFLYGCREVLQTPSRNKTDDIIEASVSGAIVGSLSSILWFASPVLVPCLTISYGVDKMMNDRKK